MLCVWLNISNIDIPNSLTRHCQQATLQGIIVKRAHERIWENVWLFSMTQPIYLQKRDVASHWNLLQTQNTASIAKTWKPYTYFDIRQAQVLHRSIVTDKDCSVSREMLHCSRRLAFHSIHAIYLKRSELLRPATSKQYRFSKHLFSLLRW